MIFIDLEKKYDIRMGKFWFGVKNYIELHKIRNMVWLKSSLGLLIITTKAELN